MAVVTRERIEPAMVGIEKTWLFRVNHRGEALDLTNDDDGPHTITGSAACVDTSETGITVTIAKKTQVGDDRGVFTATIASTALTAARAGRWRMDLFIAASGGNAQPLAFRSFTLYPDQTS